MSNGNNGFEHNKIVSINYLFFYQFFYRYILDFKKDLNYLYYDLRYSYSYRYLLKFKKYKIKEKMPILNSFLNEVAKNDNTSYQFKIYLYKILYFLNDNKNKYIKF